MKASRLMVTNAIIRSNITIHVIIIIPVPFKHLHILSQLQDRLTVTDLDHGTTHQLPLIITANRNLHCTSVLGRQQCISASVYYLCRLYSVQEESGP